MKTNRNEYKKLFIKVSEIVKKIDPENLEPGIRGGAPPDEYDPEVAQIVGYIIHSQEEIKIDKQKLISKINSIWRDSFGLICRDAEVMAREIIKIAF